MTTPLTIEAFGDALLKTGDLDPVYIMLADRERLKPELVHRFLIAYWCFYHAGVAALIAECGRKPADFWRLMREAARNETSPGGTALHGGRWPRGAERRHFRGANGIEAVGGLASRYRDSTAAVYGMIGPIDLRTSGAGDERRSFAGVSRAVQSHAGFGPWMAFKIADMAERVLGYTVDFSDCALSMYRDPTQGAALAHYLRVIRPANERLGDARSPEPFAGQEWRWPATPEIVREEVEHQLKTFRKYKAPPLGDRRVNIQEVETILCKWKSHYKGHYAVGKDTAEIGQGLMGWGDLSEQLSQNLNETRDKVVRWCDKNRGQGVLL